MKVQIHRTTRGVKIDTIVLTQKDTQERKQLISWGVKKLRRNCFGRVLCLTPHGVNVAYLYV